MDQGLWNMVANAGGVEQAVLVLLAIASMVMWSIIFLKVPEIRRARKSSAKFMARFADAQSFGDLKDGDLAAGDAVQASVLRSALGALAGKEPSRAARRSYDPEKFRINPENPTEEIVLLSMQHTSALYYAHMQRGLPFLSITGSTTPFIGLFGTVVGIMTTFQALGAVKTPSMQVVAPGISGALVATAAGLAVAIPAVIAYSWFSSQIDQLQDESDCFIEKLMALIRANTQGETAPHAETPRAAPIPTPAPSPAVKTRETAGDSEAVLGDDAVPKAAIKPRPATPTVVKRPTALAAGVGKTDSDVVSVKRAAK
jgi:biopolymer transport protein TolQ